MTNADLPPPPADASAADARRRSRPAADAADPPLPTCHPQTTRHRVSGRWQQVGGGHCSF